MTSEKVEGLWKEYLSHNPTKNDLKKVFFGASEGVLKEMTWEELKKRKDLDKEDVLDAFLYSWNSELVRRDAWEILSTSNQLTTEEMERMVAALDPSHPISKEIGEVIGRSKSQIMQEIKEQLA